MLRYITFILVILNLTACSGLKKVEILPSSTVVTSSTITNVPDSTPTIKPLNTLLPSSTSISANPILDDFPIRVGTVWQYSAEITYEDPRNSNQLLTWNGTVTDMVIDQKNKQDGKVIFFVQEDMEPKPPEQVWRQPGMIEYQVSGNGVYREGMKFYQYPLTNNVKWRAFSDMDYEIMVRKVDAVITPNGQQDNCYSLTLITNPETSMDTFCAGIGFVSRFYTHHGTAQNEIFVLSSFTLGQQ